MSRSERAGARLLIVEESLKDHRGHWFSYARRVAEINRAEGVSVEAAVHADVDPTLEWALPVHAIFRASYWDGSYPAHRRVRRQRRGVLAANRRFHRELGGHLARSARYDLVFAPSVIAHQLLAWLALLLRHRARIGCAVLLLRMGPTEPHDIPGEPICGWNARFLRRCLGLFRPLQRSGRVRFATDSRALAETYEALCGMPFTVLPSPMQLPAQAAPRERTPGAPLRLVAPGVQSYIKGIDVLLEAIRLLRDDPPDTPLRFVIQWPKQAQAVGREPLHPDEALEAGGLVEYVRRDLPADAYDDLVRSADAIVLPYRVDPYRLRTSGVIVEAMSVGVPVIVTAGTTLEEGLRTGGAGLIAADGDPRDLAERIRALAADADKLRAQARERTADARAHHAPERFQALLWGDVPEPGA